MTSTPPDENNSWPSPSFGGWLKRHGVLPTPCSLAVIRNTYASTRQATLGGLGRIKRAFGAAAKREGGCISPANYRRTHPRPPTQRRAGPRPLRAGTWHRPSHVFHFKEEEPSPELVSVHGHRGSAERPGEGFKLAGMNNPESATCYLNRYFIPGADLLVSQLLALLKANNRHYILRPNFFYTAFCIPCLCKGR